MLNGYLVVYAPYSNFPLSLSPPLLHVDIEIFDLSLNDLANSSVIIFYVITEFILYIRIAHLPRYRLPMGKPDRDGPAL
jgi:hypothetical protein